MISMAATRTFELLGGLMLAAAKTGDGYEPPDAEGSTVAIAYVVALVAVLVIAALAFKKSGRTHLD